MCDSFGDSILWTLKIKQIKELIIKTISTKYPTSMNITSRDILKRSNNGNNNDTLIWIDINDQNIQKLDFDHPDNFKHLYYSLDLLYRNFDELSTSPTFRTRLLFVSM